jgi:glyoxylase-like metal-dependent hydrolase (beta-lactamase superfamily II)
MNDIIKKIKMGKSNAYLINTEKGYILVDAGMENKINKVQGVLTEISAEWEDIILIIITHVHPDHVGSLYDLKEKTKAKVLVHEKEKKLLKEGKTDFPKGTTFLSKMISKFGNLFLEGEFKTVDPDITINDCYNLKKYGVEGKVIHTPGHTEGSLSVIIEEKNIICGDTLFNILPNSVYPPFANDKKQLIESWKKINEYSCDKFYPGHGDVFDRKKFIKTLKRKT